MGSIYLRLEVGVLLAKLSLIIFGMVVQRHPHNFQNFQFRTSTSQHDHNGKLQLLILLHGHVSQQLRNVNRIIKLVGPILFK